MVFSLIKESRSRRIHRHENQALIVASFPPAYHAQAQDLASKLANFRDFSAHLWTDRWQARVLGWMLMDECTLDLDAIGQTMLHCLYSCHGNGYVRERHLRALANSSHPELAMPFMVQSFGNWVRKVQLVAFAGLMKQPEAFIAFVQANPQAWQAAKSRATSYWDCYYQGEDGYPWRQSQTRARIQALAQLLKSG